MRFRTARPRTDEERLLPLINIVFLLLIVFLLAGRLATTDPFQVEPPISSSDGAAPKRATVVHVAADGRVAIDGTVTDDAGLRSAARGPASAGEVHVKADGQADSTRVIAVMEILRSAGSDRIVLLTLPADH